MNDAAKVWRSIPGFEGYEVSDDGCVRSYWRCATGKGRGAKELATTPKLMRPLILKNGRKQLTIGQGADRSVRKVAPLILLSFVGPRPAGMFACHNNGDPSDDRISNLRWGTPKSNSADMIKHGRHDPRRGSRQSHAVLTDELVRKIRSSKGRITQAKWAAIIGCSRATIYRVRCGKTWGHLK